MRCGAVECLVFELRSITGDGVECLILGLGGREDLIEVLVLVG